MKRSFRIPVRLGPRGYEIRIGSGHLAGFGHLLRRLKLGTEPVVISNRSILRRHGPSLRAALQRAGFRFQAVTVMDSERSKGISTLGRLLTELARRDGPGKRLLLILAGGGVIGDVGGMAAGLYRRGIPFVQLPTTLLAQVDSSIGGKTGIDLPEGKNLAGLFIQPRLVFIETGFLATLSDRQFRSGLAEVLKCGILGDPPLFSLLERTPVAELRADRAKASWMIARAAKVKARVVEQDEFEARGIRTLLNLGHTFGHALETASGYRRSVTHGEAVGLGIRVASEISWRMGWLAESARARIHEALDHLGLPRSARGIRRDALFRAMAHDKKWTSGRNRWVLPVAIGRCVVRRDLPERIIRAAAGSVLEDR